MRRRSGLWLAAAALAALLCCGCAGILAESEKDGQTERLRLGTTDKWSTYDRNSTKQNESVFMLKKESTF
ncbi:MAG: hypothetical protein ACHQ2F_01765 [Desulfobaccales bacterium]